MASVMLVSQCVKVLPVGIHIKLASHQLKTILELWGIYGLFSCYISDYCALIV